MTSLHFKENASDKSFVLEKLGNTYRLQLKSITHIKPDTFKDVNLLIDYIVRHGLKEKIHGLSCLPEFQYKRLFPVEPVLLQEHVVQLLNTSL